MNVVTTRIAEVSSYLHIETTVELHQQNTRQHRRMWAQLQCNEWIQMRSVLLVTHVPALMFIKINGPPYHSGVRTRSWLVQHRSATDPRQAILAYCCEATKSILVAFFPDCWTNLLIVSLHGLLKWKLNLWTLRCKLNNVVWLRLTWNWMKLTS